MRMWQIDPVLLCRQHLLGEHREMHALAGSLRLGKSIQGYIDKKLIYVPEVNKRHDDLVIEMQRRGYNHQTPLAQAPSFDHKNTISVTENIDDLFNRCPHCRQRITTFVEVLNNRKAKSED